MAREGQEEMSKLEKLLAELCPNGVEYKTLAGPDGLGEFFSGLTGKSKEDFRDGNAKFISYMNVFSNPALDINALDRVKIVQGETQNTLEYRDIIFTGSSETPDECGMSSVVTQKPTEKLYLNSFCFGFRLHNPELFNPDYLKHFFRSDAMRKQIARTANGVTRFNVSKVKMAQLEIPVPPLEVQEEIVRILDAFTELTAELTAELRARQQQYEHYRDALLSFDDVNNKLHTGG